jgi:hypothetical protein
MLLTTPSDLDRRAPWTAQNARLDLVERWQWSRQVCEEAQAACGTAAQLRQETAQLRAEGIHRRHKGLAGPCETLPPRCQAMS